VSNWAQDFSINAIIHDGQIGELHPDWLYNPAFKAGQAWQEIYHKIYEQMQGGKAPDWQCLAAMGLPGNMKPQDTHLAPGTAEGADPAEAVASNSDLEWKQAIKGALAVGEKAGRTPFEITKLFGAMVEPVVQWQDRVLGILARSTGGGGYNFRRADRRLIVRNIYAPQRSGKGCGTLVLGADSSGSIYRKPKLIDYLISEIGGVLDQLKPQRIVVVWCDAKVQRVDEVFDATDIEVVRQKGAKGGGGTKFWPVFKYVEEQGIDPDALIYLTDLEGDFPDKAPSYPVLWGNFGRKEGTAPFGDVIHIERPS
jgi:predicted metal-dependent peptidase